MGKKKKQTAQGRHRLSIRPLDGVAADPIPFRRRPIFKWLIVGTVAMFAISGFLFYFMNPLPERVGKKSEPSASATTSAPSSMNPRVQYVGGQACAGCHVREYEAWHGSHHDLAMQEAHAQTVLGDFNNARFAYAGITSTFFKRDGRFYINTDGPDGKLADYEIKYTFGVTPLQQYLIEFPGGRMQALSIAWDTRPKGQGGQRWFHLYPNERITHKDELHWAGPQQNWNFMCADCHSTNLKKNYDAASHRFKTSWSEVNVSCEACHGPGSRHVEWARPDGSGEKKTDPAKGLAVSFKERRAMRWTMVPETDTARPQQARPLHTELGVCAPCHARRTTIAEGFEAGGAFLDHYLPALLEPPLYYPDGQQREEVYTWGSFLQSRMYRQGVTCSDCHEPHSLKLHAPGNGVCAQCHLPAKYDADSHHFHQPGGSGAQCVNCHMPATTYMVIDPRHDHSFRVPRPDRSVTLGTPNACNQCHRDKSPEWSAEQLVRWYGHSAGGFQRFVFAPGEAELIKLMVDTTQPEIVRATAAAVISRAPDPAAVTAAVKLLGDDSPLVRYAALATLELLPPAQRVQFAASLLDDPVKIVRMEAARVLAPVPASAFSPAQKNSFDRAASEYMGAQRLHADRPEHRTNLGTFYTQLGRYEEAEAEFRAALDLPLAYVPAWVNYADFKRLQGSDGEAEALLRRGLAELPDAAPLHHALGLTLVRLGRTAESLQELADAARLAPDEPRFVYVYAVALHSAGRVREALTALEQALARHPGDRELLLAAATFSRDAGDRTAALQYAEQLALQAPEDPVVQRLFEELRGDSPP